MDLQSVLSQEVVHQLIARYHWQLLDGETLSRRLFERAQSAAISEREPLVKLAITLYCEEWYAACSSEGERRSLAYSELAHYLYDSARHKYGNNDMAQEIAHDALILVSEQLGSCQKPGAFLAFVSLKLWNAATSYLRQRDRQTQRTEALPDESTEYAGATADLKDADPTPEERVVSSELTTTLLTRVGELMQQSPRAHPQFKAVLLKFLYGYSDEEIAGELDTEVQNVHVLRSRGLKRLREDPLLKELFEGR
jgi:RNA polymerase sigma factor (sigma-70 family)